MIECRESTALAAAGQMFGEVGNFVVIVPTGESMKLTINPISDISYESGLRFVLGRR